VTTAPEDPPDPPDDHRRYRQIAAVLRRRIESGELASGNRMPGTRSLKVEFNTSHETAQKALRVLEADGLIKKWPGVGYWVLPASDD
jgi:DNA-binding GntR family transcriptional regulator